MPRTSRVTVSFWLFVAAATVSGGLLGRYLAATTTGHATLAALVLTPVLAIAFAFSVAVLVRIVRASSHTRVTARTPHPSDDP
jgi:hypothetical protein